MLPYWGRISECLQNNFPENYSRHFVGLKGKATTPGFCLCRDLNAAFVPKRLGPDQLGDLHRIVKQPFRDRFD